MSAEEIVRGLRTSTPKCYPINCDRCTGVIDSLDCDYFVAQKAADLIESQAAEVKDLNEQMEACCQQIGLMTSDYENQIRILKAQFSASQQETRAAVEDMKHIADGIQRCREELRDFEPVSSLNLGRCDVCKKYCHDDNGCRFEWRGHQQAGDGERDGD